jgi:DNA-directed RNA polymerase subunit RPC12/RpoP
MSDIRFRCAGCSTKLVVDDSAAGRLVNCPYCQLRIEVPARSSLEPSLKDLPAGDAAEVHFRCAACGGKLKTPRKYVGARANCPRCAKSIVLGESAAVPPAAVAPPVPPPPSEPPQQSPRVRLSADEIAMLTGNAHDPGGGTVPSRPEP